MNALWNGDDASKRGRESPFAQQVSCVLLLAHARSYDGAGGASFHSQ